MSVYHKGNVEYNNEDEYDDYVPFEVLTNPTNDNYDF